MCNFVNYLGYSKYQNPELTHASVIKQIFINTYSTNFMQNSQEKQFWEEIRKTSHLSNCVARDASGIQLLLTLRLATTSQAVRLPHESTNLHHRVTQSVHFKISAKSSGKWLSARGRLGVRGERTSEWAAGICAIRRGIDEVCGKSAAQASAGNCQSPNWVSECVGWKCIITYCSPARNANQLLPLACWRA